MTEEIRVLDDAPSLWQPRFILCRLGLHDWSLFWGLSEKGVDEQDGWHIDWCKRGCRRARWWKCPCPYHEDTTL